MVWTTGIIADERGCIGASPDEMAARIGYVLAHRSGDGPFDVMIEGYSDAGAAGIELAASYEAAGATWWCDSINGLRAPVDDLLARVAAGPPRG